MKIKDILPILEAKSDTVYKNSTNTIRIRIFRRGSGRWDYDIFKKNGDFENFSSEAGDDFRTKKEALIKATENFGKLKSMGNIETVTQGW